MDVSTWTKNLPILEMSSIPADAGENVFEGDYDRTDESCLGVSCDIRDVGSHDETKVAVMPVSNNFAIEKVSAPTTAPLHIFKGFIVDDAPTKNQKHLRFEIIFSGLLFSNIQVKTLFRRHRRLHRQHFPR